MRWIKVGGWGGSKDPARHSQAFLAYRGLLSACNFGSKPFCPSLCCFFYPSRVAPPLKISFTKSNSLLLKWRLISPLLCYCFLFGGVFSPPKSDLGAFPVWQFDPDPISPFHFRWWSVWIFFNVCSPLFLVNSITDSLDDKAQILSSAKWSLTQVSLIGIQELV